jgi:hypothetical protein
MNKDGKIGIIIEMEVRKQYSEGIGACRHWHYGDEEKEMS